MSENRERIWGTLDPFIESGPVLGRKVAGERFLDALMQADPFDAYHFFPEGKAARKRLEDALSKRYPNTAAKIAVLDRRDLPQRLAETEYHCFHQSDCITSQPALAALRNEVSRTIFPITGTIHSLSYQHYGELFLRHISAGTTKRDAIVCTSRAGREAVSRLFESLMKGYGLDRERFAAPALPRIPLGVNVSDFSPREHVPAGPCRFLVFGRISHFSKMDLLPLLRAFHRLFTDGLSRESVHLTLAGWTDEGDDFLPTLKELAKNIGLAMEVCERPDEATKKTLFAQSDVFVSIADNPQETFGITVLEAGAAGLPAVVSDYDGYRDLVEDGVTGVRIPTIGPARTPEVDRMAPLTFDSSYHLTLAQETAVSTPALAEALGKLAQDVALRKEMGTAARKRMENRYDWSQVIREYMALWDSLWDEPVDEQAVRKTTPPARIHYGNMFGHYPSRQLQGGMLVQAGRTGEAVYRGREFVLPYAGMERHINPDHARMVAFHARKPVSCDILAQRLMDSEGLTPEAADYLILWSLKHDILETAD